MAKISNCKYFRCSKCGTVYEKKKELTFWGVSSYIHSGGLKPGDAIGGSRTCWCGNVMWAQDIYLGVHDCPALRRLIHFLWLKFQGK